MKTKMYQNSSKCGKGKMFFTLTLVAALMFAGCKDNNDTPEDTGGNTFNGTITGKIDNGDPAITKVEAVGFGHSFASGNCSGGSFSITLPKTVSNDICLKMESVYDYWDATLSDKNARTAAFIGLCCYNSAGKDVGFIQLQKDDDVVRSAAMFVYVDRNVTVSGTSGGTVFQNVTFKKGWNIVYITRQPYEGTEQWSNQEPGGLKWSN